MLFGRSRAFADFDRSIALPSSSADGRWLSREGRDDAGDFGILKFEPCDFDLDESSKDGRDGRVKSGRKDDGLGCGFSNVRGVLNARA